MDNNDRNWSSIRLYTEEDGLNEFTLIGITAGYHILEIEWRATHVKVYVDSVLKATHTLRIPDGNSYIRLQGCQKPTLPQWETKVDYVRLTA